MNRTAQLSAGPILAPRFHDLDPFHVRIAIGQAFEIVGWILQAVGNRRVLGHRLRDRREHPRRDGGESQRRSRVRAVEKRLRVGDPELAGEGEDLGVK